uniref:EF-hand domain-containing protein n=1 Tax=Paramoeba aestuarina TaxID=180227 RepID=A0A7S4KXN1_9EUKA|mmetsp:Transcript_27618/g.42885  ORF Transcript_27618/g.42885 Transcript_27618/m.42885 type:complete len:263 (+) Transcript_27618:50-838(+)|eukprot:CAMPEP_0201521128 /NCGR_PEP_ID=MMETSP0161_2-20130828/14237_1 /ASSEMBLY_ACC=CAM_ASM_000251 /TAXON_ID=180227 /ORGANISM="Neoparamoeba aestuarina, Strain SoJaBio B1-5/56/2" /LENGTH=262 /DNA_ID=CAMNT_0047919705 /DNA_START=34 /DNA_END=822 /DNA_ORIENTATION=+
MESASQATGLFFKLQEIKTKFGITSWIEMGMIGVTIYLAFCYVLSLIGLTPPMTSVAGVAGLLFCCYQVFLLASLSERLEEYKKQNKILEKNNKKLTENVDSFTQQNVELKKVTDNLNAENERFKGELAHLSGTLSNLEVVKETIENFGEEEKNDLGDVLAGLQGTIEEQKEVVQRQEGILKSTEEATNTQEKALLLTLQSQCQFIDKNMGMSREEFDTFINMLPDKFKSHGFDFAALDKDGSGHLDVGEFQSLIDDLVKGY